MVENRLQKLVEEGKITQEEADEFLGWWQARPEGIPLGPGHRGFGGMHGFKNPCLRAE
jgi:hypothetical protein